MKTTLELSYQQFIDDINSGKIKRTVFSVENYAHYSNCLIGQATDNISLGKDTVHIDYISVKLTKDSEQFSFISKFNEKIKLFDMKRKGKFTLKQMWDRIKFISIDYAEND